MKKFKFYLELFRSQSDIHIEGQKEPSIPLRTLKAEYPNHWLHKTDLAATQGASAGASRL
ncbi:hypothetical protein [Gemmiger formicilis]|uniref:hypothetical protein n=1 Tax=Gemmiger formicilis TaxID=745368 RepID=UPI00352060CD